MPEPSFEPPQQNSGREELTKDRDNVHGDDVQEREKHKDNEYVNERGEIYRVLDPTEAYQTASEARDEQQREEVLESLKTRPTPSIYEESALVEDTGEEKFFRPRMRGNTDKIVASGVAAKMLDSPNAEIRNEQIRGGERVVLEEFILGAKECKPSDIASMSQEEVDRTIAHALITEDLDCQSRNFVVDRTGRVIRVDSKLVFQDKYDKYPAEDVSTEEARQTIVRARLASDQGLRSLIHRADLKNVKTLTESFDPEDFSDFLTKSGIQPAIVNDLTEKAVLNKSKATERLSQYKEFITK